jgi:hypothetical protein
VSFLSCLYNLVIGSKHPRYAPSSWQTCISANQAKTLFGTETKPKPLGCGTFACVYPHRDPDKVVKITRDETDVAALYAGQDVDVVPKLYAGHRLAGRAFWRRYEPPRAQGSNWPRQPQAYALVLERLRPFTPTEKRKWSPRINKLVWRQRLTAAYNAEPMSDEALIAEVCPRKPGPNQEECRTRLAELQTIRDRLQDAGVNWTDVHAGNIGVDNEGRWRALDVGASRTPLDVDVPELQGPQRRRRARR